jgi:threonine dehydrogenase-like Zn-dependent dehydrogenase
MKALLKNIETTEVTDYSLNHQHDVLIKVDTAGICRTDIYASQNKIITAETVVLGHEFSGYVAQSKSNKFKEGDIVTVNPIYDDLTMIGVEHHGCFAEFVSIPSSQVYSMGNFNNMRVSAYIEPIAASLAPLKSRLINKQMVGAVYGENRIGKLTYEIMIKNGYNVVLIDSLTVLEPNSFDYVIETLATTHTFDIMSKIIKKNGVLILKSRFPNHIPVNFYDYVRKEILIESLYYHDFAFAVEYAKNHYMDFNHLLGDSYILDDWKKAFTASETGDKKIFFKF